MNFDSRDVGQLGPSHASKRWQSASLARWSSQKAAGLLSVSRGAGTPCSYHSLPSPGPLRSIFYPLLSLFFFFCPLSGCAVVAAGPRTTRGQMRQVPVSKLCSLALHFEFLDFWFTHHLVASGITLFKRLCSHCLKLGKDAVLSRDL